MEPTQLCTEGSWGTRGVNGPWDDDLHHIESEYIESGGDFYVGVLEGGIVAMGALRRRSDTLGEICRMRVQTDLQRRGFGTQMLSMLERWAVDLGFRILKLDTTVEQVAAIGLYMKAGYQQVGRGEKLGFLVVYFKKQL